MIKYYQQDSHPALMEACGGIMFHLLETSSMVKQANTSKVSRELLESHKPDKDHFAALVVGIGDGETYGWNMNGDYWPARYNEDKADTFVKYGAYYEEHNSNAKDKRRGQIKYAVYNPDMKRIELIVWGHKKKAAEDYEAAKSGKPLCYSMSAHVDRDECSLCKNAAKKVADYCEHTRQLTRYNPLFNKYAYLINHDPTFYDMSKVAVPAQSICRTVDYLLHPDDLKKAASHRSVKPSAVLALEMGVTDHSRQNVSDFVVDASLLKVASVVEESPTDVERFAMGVFRDAGRDVDDRTIESLRYIRPRTLFHKMAKACALMPLPMFIAYTTGRPYSEVKADANVQSARDIPFSKAASLAAKYQPDVQEMLPQLRAGSESEVIMDYTFGADASAAISIVSVSCGIHKDAVLKNCKFVGKPLCKKASSNTSVTEEAEKYAALYLLYKQAAFKDINDNFELNKVDPYYSLAIIAAV